MDSFLRLTAEPRISAKSIFSPPVRPIQCSLLLAHFLVGNPHQLPPFSVHDFMFLCSIPYFSTQVRQLQVFSACAFFACVTSAPAIGLTNRTRRESQPAGCLASSPSPHQHGLISTSSVCSRASRFLRPPAQWNQIRRNGV